ncbi:ABC transporter ATP-binding protein [Microbacterium sp. NPDC055910]|uniref:ABC transporter ATP-binding protein n=1 Tax=Microbacterium sp. NPDC055910 TaxID=3345659 RepID=UPI0035DB61E2
MLEIRDLQVSYGAVRAVRGVSLHAAPGRVSLVLGANGAGKSTTLRAAAGFLRQAEGSVSLDGDELLGRPANAVVRRGVTLVPEGRKIFAPLTVEENLRLGGYLTPKREAAEILDTVYERFPILSERRHGVAGLLSGGEQQMLAFGRALMSRPRVILMDEPSMGLAPTMVHTVMRSVREIADSGVAVLMVEQNANASLRIADDVSVMSRGATTWTGLAGEVDIHALHVLLGEGIFDEHTPQ